MFLNFDYFLKTSGDGFNPINRRERRNNAHSKFTLSNSLFLISRIIAFIEVPTNKIVKSLKYIFTHVNS